MRELKIIQNLFEKLFFIAVFVLIPVLSFTIVTSRTSALFGFQSFTVLTGSMNPNIPTGSIVYTQKADKINKGDVITFKRNSITITHRVVDITDKNGKSISSLISPIPGAPLPEDVFFKTKGDANKVADKDLVSAKDVIGKTFISMPAIGKLTSFLKTIPGFLILIIGPTLIFIGFEMWNIKKEIEKQTEKKIMEKLNLIT